MTHRILLARHGTHDEVGHVLSGRSEIALNPRGHAQAEALAWQLAGGAVRSIHASPRRRCTETAAPIARTLGLPLTSAPALDEIDFGAFAGRRFDALATEAAWRHWNEARDVARCPGGETMAEAAERARTYLLALDRTLGPTLCVTHCDVIRALACDALGLDCDHLLALPCDPGSLTLIDIDGDTLRLVSLNLRPGQPADQ